MKNPTPRLVAALIAAFGVLLFSIPVRADAMVLICEKDKACTVETARIFFLVRVESPLPAECLKTGMRKIAEVADLVDKAESVRVNCNGR